METIGFIGTGIMGNGMVRNLMKAGYPVQIYSRTRAKAQALEEAGAQWKETAAACVQGAQVVITMVGYPQDVEQLYFSPGGILDSAAPGTCLIDMTTTSPRLSQRIYQAAAKRGVQALDAPVSGGSTGAAEGTLAIMVGGDEEAFQACLPILRAMGTNIVLEGGPGAGQHTKMANQIAVAGAAAGVAEAMAYAMRAGLDPERVFQTVRTGAAGGAQMESLAPRMIAGDFSPTFYLRHFVKDMTIAHEEAQSRDLQLGVLDEVLDRCRRLEEQGCGHLGNAALPHSHLDQA